MNGTRWVLAGFAAVGLAMILVPAALFAFATNVPVPREKGLDGAISRIFLLHSQSLEQPVPSVADILSRGLPETQAIRALTESGFLCHKAADRLLCRRGHNGLSCKDDWLVDVALDGHDVIASTSAERRATCL